ncbi:hypothetical protein [Paenibacillus macerans]|uniref:hypothetical protein n=1 Tax=Paenibacillus macerans TaxID=44252 RepID=UPI00203A3E97|nr:hypothetical protein [Paenibacillus macerans]MCM3698602.1 hypothetical protein [Paenibacillus macerans]
MKKKVYATALTVGAAAALIAGNGAFSAFAFANETAPTVKVTGQHQQTEFEGVFSAVPATNTLGLSVAPEKTSEDMSEDKAVDIAKKALEKKFDVSLDGMKAFPIFCTREDMEGTFYFVSFMDIQVVDAQWAVPAKSGETVSSETVAVSVTGKNDKVDVYIAFVDSKTGEVVSAEKNPIAENDTAAPTAPVDPVN